MRGGGHGVWGVASCLGQEDKQVKKMKKKPAASTFSDPQPLLHQGVGLTWPDAWVSQGTGPEPAEAEEKLSIRSVTCTEVQLQGVNPRVYTQGAAAARPLPPFHSLKSRDHQCAAAGGLRYRVFPSELVPGDYPRISGTKSRATAREPRRWYRRKKWDQGTWMSKARAKLTRLTQGAGL